MNSTVKDILAKRSKLIQEMHDLTKNDGSWNSKEPAAAAEASKRWNELNGQQENMKRQADAITSTEKLQEDELRVAAPPAAQIESPEALATRNEVAVSEVEKRYHEIAADQEYRNGFLHWVRSGEQTAKFQTMARELRTYSALNTGSASAGETLIPIGFQRELEIVMKAYGGMRRNARIVPTSTGNPLHWPAVDDTANQGRWLSESGAVSQTNPTFSEIVYSAYLASSDQVLISVQLMQDSAFPIESLLAELLGIRLGRLSDAGYTTGSGSTQPTGIITSILADSVPLTVTATGSGANDGVGGNVGNNSIGTDDLSNLIALVDPSYRDGAKFLAHWSVIDYLRKVKDKFGRPLFVPMVSEGEEDRIFGYPYDWSGAMDAAVSGLPAASKNSVLFGKFDKYIIRDVLGITLVRYNELYMPNHQIGFQAYLRTDGQRLQQKAFSLLVQHS